MTRAVTIGSAAIFAAVLVGLSLGLVRCDKLTPNSGLGTMSLLRSGSEKVCVASDVQVVLRRLILPTVDEVEEVGSVELAVAATKRVAISFNTTSLDSIDRAVSRATCRTVARISGPVGAASTFPITYQVSPSAEHPETFVVGGIGEEARVYARN